MRMVASFEYDYEDFYRRGTHRSDFSGWGRVVWFRLWMLSLGASVLAMIWASVLLACKAH